MKDSGLICDRKLWDCLGNSCRASLYAYGHGTFELYLTDFNSSVPRRYIGRIGLLNNIAETFIRERKAAGFEEQLPSYEPAWIP
jgi:hypothetical protein